MERELERDGDQSQGEWEALSCRHMGGSETWRGLLRSVLICTYSQVAAVNEEETSYD